MLDGICVVYWLHDDQCICPWRHGWIGISQDFKGRLKTHRGNKNFPKDFETKILFSGTASECRNLEWLLRPGPRIGWNLAAGGGKSQFGIPRSLEAKQKMSEAGRRRPPILESTREKLRVASTGRTNRGRLGQKKSAEERAKISASHIGKKASDETRRNQSLRMLGTAYHAGHAHSEETKAIIRAKKLGVAIHSEEHKRKLTERMKGNSYTKGRPWSSARRLAYERARKARNMS